LGTDTEENYYNRGNKDFSVEDVGYEFNSLGYRGPNFERVAGEAAVMFVGDSNTLGLGMPWDKLWTSQVVKYLAQRWGAPVRQFNLAWAGTGSDYVAMMVHQAVDVLRPEAVFILWSFIERMDWFADTRSLVRFHANYVPPSREKDHSAYLRLATPAQRFFNYVRNFHFVNERLQRLQVPYLWGNLEQFSLEMLRTYLPLAGYAGNWTILDLARDGCHGGLRSHAFFADLMVAAIERDKAIPTRAPDNLGATPLQSGPAGQISRSERISGLFTRSKRVRELLDRIHFDRRVRASRRKDPFIY
jgi:hypothetical protein